MKESIYQEKFTCDTCGKSEIIPSGATPKHVWGKTPELRMSGFTYGDREGVVVLKAGDFCSKKCFDTKVAETSLADILQEKGWPEAWVEKKRREDI